VGILDTYFPNARFFTEFERFDRFCEKIIAGGTKIDYVSICSPNYLHDAHIRIALRNNANAICEKPLVLNSWNLDALQEIEQETGKNIYTILQLRLHPVIKNLKRQIDESPLGKVYDVSLKYITSRGKWYFVSWKGDFDKSGGLATNIGIHFFDMLGWVFGDFKGVELITKEDVKIGGKLYFQKANVSWFLSVDENDLPNEIKDSGKRTYRNLTIDGEHLEFSDGFTDLHTISYQNILAGNGFGIRDAAQSIKIVSNLR
jgi:UDP-N-acetyl-2-amino-2-deoxyglucuronate dehydrogenase